MGGEDKDDPFRRLKPALRPNDAVDDPFTKRRLQALAQDLRTNSRRPGHAMPVRPMNPNGRTKG